MGRCFNSGVWSFTTMVFPVSITGPRTGTGNNLFPQWCLDRTGNRNREHLWAWSPREVAGGYNLSLNFFLRCRSASESVFPGILDQTFRDFIDFKNVFSDAEVL